MHRFLRLSLLTLLSGFVCLGAAEARPIPVAERAQFAAKLRSAQTTLQDESLGVRQRRDAVAAVMRQARSLGLKRLPSALRQELKQVRQAAFVLKHRDHLLSEVGIRLNDLDLRAPHQYLGLLDKVVQASGLKGEAGAFLVAEAFQQARKRILPQHAAEVASLMREVCRRGETPYGKAYLGTLENGLANQPQSLLEAGRVPLPHDLRYQLADRELRTLRDRDPFGWALKIFQTLKASGSSDTVKAQVAVDTMRELADATDLQSVWRSYGQKKETWYRGLLPWNMYFHSAATTPRAKAVMGALLDWQTRAAGDERANYHGAGTREAGGNRDRPPGPLSLEQARTRLDLLLPIEVPSYTGVSAGGAIRDMAAHDRYAAYWHGGPLEMHPGIAMGFQRGRSWRERAALWAASEGIDLAEFIRRNPGDYVPSPMSLRRGGGGGGAPAAGPSDGPASAAPAARPSRPSPDPWWHFVFRTPSWQGFVQAKARGQYGGSWGDWLSGQR